MTDGSDQAALSRSAIVAAAIELADAGGLTAASMRKVADALGAGTMSLYNHVRDRGDLEGAMLEEVIGEVALPPADDAWRSAMRTTAMSLRAMLTRHPWACELWGSTYPGLARKRLMESWLACLRTAGFSPRLAHHGFHAVDLYVVGHVQQDQAFDLGDDLEALEAQFMAETPEEDFPYLVEHVEQHDGDGSDGDFEFMLGLLLDGLDQHRDVTGDSAR